MVSPTPMGFLLGSRPWRICAERMKSRREHRVPLSARAREILAEARAHRHRFPLIGRARADLPVELQTLDGNLGRALRRVSAMSLAVPPGSLLTLLAISSRYRLLGHFL